MGLSSTALSSMTEEIKYHISDVTAPSVDAPDTEQSGSNSDTDLRLPKKVIYEELNEHSRATPMDNMVSTTFPEKSLTRRRITRRLFLLSAFLTPINQTRLNMARTLSEAKCLSILPFHYTCGDPLWSKHYHAYELHTLVDGSPQLLFVNQRGNTRHELTLLLQLLKPPPTLAYVQTLVLDFTSFHTKVRTYQCAMFSTHNPLCHPCSLGIHRP